jgi:hypothetical protein
MHQVRYLYESAPGAPGVPKVCSRDVRWFVCGQVHRWGTVRATFRPNPQRRRLRTSPTAPTSPSASPAPSAATPHTATWSWSGASAKPSFAEPGPAAGSPRRRLPQDRSGGRAVADRAQPGRPSDARRWRDRRVPAGGRVDQGRAGARDRLRRSGQQRLAGGQPVHGGRAAGAQPAGGHRDLSQRAAARRDRAEEPGRREGHDRRR